MQTTEDHVEAVGANWHEKSGDAFDAHRRQNPAYIASSGSHRKTSRRREFLGRGPLVVTDLAAAVTLIDGGDGLSAERLSQAFMASKNSTARLLDVSWERMACRAWCGAAPQVYAVCFEEPSRGSLVKVGFSSNLSKRLPQLVSDLLKIDARMDRKLVQWRQIFGVRFTTESHARIFEQLLHGQLGQYAISVGREWYEDNWGVSASLLRAYCCCLELFELRSAEQELLSK
jgi:hypothetical protein